MKSSNIYKTLEGKNSIKNEIENYDNLSMNTNDSYFNFIPKQKLLKHEYLELNGYNTNTVLSINNKKAQKIISNPNQAKNSNNNTISGKTNINFINNENNLYIL